MNEPSGPRAGDLPAVSHRSVRAQDAGMSSEHAVVLRTVELTKTFGQHTAVDHLDLEVRAGEVHGFLGPNGSGKSTTIGMVLGLIEPTAGSIERPADMRRSIGAIIESPAFYPYLSGEDNLRALALASGGVPRGRIGELLRLVGLTERGRSKYRTYSLGMKQRLGIASTLLTDPQLVILDEPTNGLDPAGQHEIRELIPRLAAEGRAVLVASHLLHEVQQVCDRVSIIQRGRLVRTATVESLLHDGEHLIVRVAEIETAAAILRGLPGVEQVTGHDGALQVFTPAVNGAAITRALAGHGLYVEALIPHQSTLEDVFLELTSGDGNGGAP